MKNQINTFSDFINEAKSKAKGKESTQTLEVVYQGPIKKYRGDLFKARKEDNGTYTVFLDEPGREIVEVPASDVRLVESRVSEADQKFKDFSEARGAGAAKIADGAKERGGNAMLSYHHFVVKLPYYKKAAKGWTKADRDATVTKYNQLIDELYSTKSSVKIDQTAFQKLVGTIEVFGELVIKYDEIY